MEKYKIECDIKDGKPTHAIPVSSGPYSLCCHSTGDQCPVFVKVRPNPKYVTFIGYFCGWDFRKSVKPSP